MLHTEALLGEWVHAHEEDHDGLEVYRRADHPLPPARGRRRLEFRPDGELVEWAIGRADRSEPRPGRWDVRDDGTVVGRTDATGMEWNVVRVADGVLELRAGGSS